MKTAKLLVSDLKKSRPVFRVGKDSWHYKLYKWWLNHGGHVPEGGEGFCHYTRVILRTIFIWLPLAGLKKIFFPAMISIMVGAFGLYLIGIVSKYGFDAILGALVILGVLIGMVSIAYLLSRIKFITNFLSWLDKNYYLEIKQFSIGFKPYYVIILGLFLAIAYFSFDAILFMIGFLIFGSILFGLVLLILVILSRISNWYRTKWVLKESVPVKPVKDTGTATPILAWELAKALKNRFACPIVEFPKSSDV